VLEPILLAVVLLACAVVLFGSWLRNRE